jgi:hypothetical protein
MPKKHGLSTIDVMTRGRPKSRGGKGGQQINIFVNLEQYRVLKEIAASAEYPTTVTKVARKLLQDAIDARINPA